MTILALLLLLTGCQQGTTEGAAFTPEERIQRGTTFLKAFAYEKAYAQFTLVLKEDPSHFDALVLRGVTLMEMGLRTYIAEAAEGDQLHLAAMSDFEAARNVEPNHPQPIYQIATLHYNRAFLEYESEKLKEERFMHIQVAIRLYEDLLDSGKDLKDGGIVHYNLGKLHAKRALVERNLESAEKAFGHLNDFLLNVKSEEFEKEAHTSLTALEDFIREEWDDEVMNTIVSKYKGR
jgi:tetratricopeptide (TPR) repeat protein